MPTIEEIPTGQTVRAGAALLALRPRWQNVAPLTEFVDSRLRPVGYRLAGVAVDGEVLSVVGFRQAWSTAWGDHVYIDDLSTLPEARGRGHAAALLEWVFDEARRLGCEAVHLDSGVGADRAAAHRLYMRHGMAITAHHFTISL